MLHVTNYLMECRCGMLALDKVLYATKAEAYEAMCRHAQLNSNLCYPTWRPVDVPVALSARSLTS